MGQSFTNAIIISNPQLYWVRWGIRQKIQDFCGIAFGGELPGEIESLIFCLQTGIGVGIVAFVLGRFVERKKWQDKDNNSTSSK